MGRSAGGSSSSQVAFTVPEQVTQFPTSGSVPVAWTCTCTVESEHAGQPVLAHIYLLGCTSQTGQVSTGGPLRSLHFRGTSRPTSGGCMPEVRCRNLWKSAEAVAGGAGRVGSLAPALGGGLGGLRSGAWQIVTSPCFAVLCRMWKSSLHPRRLPFRFPQPEPLQIRAIVPASIPRWIPRSERRQARS